MLEKNYKLAEMIFLEQVKGKEGQDGRGGLGRGKRMKDCLPKVWRELLDLEFIPCLL